MKKKQTEGEIYRSGYEKGIKHSISICKKNLRGFVVYDKDEDAQAMIYRLRENVIPSLKELLKL